MSFVLISEFLFKKNSPQKKFLILFFLCFLSLYCSRFFLFLSFHDSSPCVCSRYVYLLSFLCIFTHTLSLSLSYASSELILFLEKSFISFSCFRKNPFFISSSLVCKTVFVLSPLLFRSFFLVVIFNRVRSNKINWLSLQNNHLFKSPEELIFWISVIWCE